MIPYYIPSRAPKKASDENMAPIMDKKLTPYQQQQQQPQQPQQQNVDDSASSIGASSISSDGSRRRRRRNRNKQVTSKGNLGQPPVVQRLADSKPVRLQLGLNLDVDLELKARLQGDVCLTLLVQKKHTPRESKQLKPNYRGIVDVEEMFHMRVGRLRFRKRWIDHDVSPSLTAAVMFSIAMGGFIAGFAASRWLDTWLLAIPAPF
ncbi:uncharacterized protein CTRU02_208740 [Colletotrichum truncatum]|uniref:Uncharacterized protein n=1 Tax=Colletotrichum truncatum TaxID=5467 RepID=A0ACC3YX71_COLTU